MPAINLLWLDSDILLDWLTARSPWDVAARLLMAGGARGDWNLVVSPLTLANVFYIHRRQSGSVAALEELKELCKLVCIAEMTSAHVMQALASGRPDFEDELQIASAISLPGVTAIITRNLSDYRACGIPAMTAAEWLTTGC